MGAAACRRLRRPRRHSRQDPARFPHRHRPATNPICGYLVVEAETIEAAAKIFENHPHIGPFPGDAIDIMPFVTEPPAA